MFLLSDTILGIFKGVIRDLERTSVIDKTLVLLRREPKNYRFSRVYCFQAGVFLAFSQTVTAAPLRPDCSDRCVIAACVFLVLCRFLYTGCLLACRTVRPCKLTPRLSAAKGTIGHRRQGRLVRFSLCPSHFELFPVHYVHAKCKFLIFKFSRVMQQR